jgi:hypothetical protein
MNSNLQSRFANHFANENRTTYGVWDVVQQAEIGEPEITTASTG